MKLDAVYVNQKDQVMIEFKTSPMTGKFIEVSLDEAVELNKRLTEVLNQSHQVVFNSAYEG